MKFLFASLLVGVDSHGSLSAPPSRNGGSLDKKQVQEQESASQWYVTNVQIPGDATLPMDLITIDNERASTDPWNKYPWRAPGTAKILSPCGTGCDVGGDPWDHTGSPQCDGSAHLVDGRDLPETERVIWQQGDVVEVAWSPFVQHGGGYAYRLCPVSENLEEACFQHLERHMEFVDDFHIVHWIADGFEETIPAKRTKTGTFPAGSHWTMNPIPEGQGPPPDFPQPCKHHPCEEYPRQEELLYSIKDRVKVPNLEPGNYTISWRWDTEVSPQVWTNCGDIAITGKTLI
jgi:hypothetical protein